MTIPEIHRLLEDFNEIRSCVGNAKIALSTGSKAMAIEQIDLLAQKLQKCQERVILEITINAITKGFLE